MEKGAKAILLILAFALVSGALVTWLHPAFRKSWVAIRQGRPETSPIWQSNLGYYSEVTLTPPREGARRAE